MKKRLAAATAFLMLGSAQAQMPPMTTSALYGEIGYTFLKVDALGTSFRPDALRGILGWDVHPMFAVEGMVAGGVNDDSKSISIGGLPSTATVKIDYMYGIWLKPRYVFAQYNSELFGRFGWAHTKPEVSRPGVGSVSGSDDAFAWGVGANYRFSPNAYVGIDWMRYSNDNHLDGLTFSVGWHW